MLDVQGMELSAEEREVLAHPAVGGVILFSRNYDSPEQLRALIASVHAARKPPLLVAVDQEGGRVQRFRDGFTHLPPTGQYGKCYDNTPDRAREIAQTCGWLMAAELLVNGVDFSFAPVLDIDRGMSGVIGDRAFHQQPDVIVELALAFQRGMHEAGMASVGKHFPGHGAVVPDSHQQLPIDKRSFDEIEAEDMQPFIQLINNGLTGVMAAHIIFPEIDASPAGFSHFWLTDVLRGQLGFQGAIFSDDLSMGGASWAGDFTDRALMALEVGCDMVLVCNHPQKAIKVIEALENYRNPASAMRLLRFHAEGKLRGKHEHLPYMAEWRHAVEQLKQLETEPWLDMDKE